MVRRILTLPQDRHGLRSRSVRVKHFGPELEDLCTDLRDTFSAQSAYGLSAPQIGVLKRVFLFRHSEDDESDIVIVVNPKVISARGEERDYDGCLSIPHIYARTRRPLEIEFSGLLPDGSKYREHLTGLPARIALHELDHLDGVLFIDRLDDFDDLYTIGHVKTEAGEEETQEIPLPPEDRALMERERRPLPGFVLPQPEPGA